MKDLHQLCTLAAIEFMEQGTTRHISYISAEDTPIDGPGGRIPKVTIEWVDESETLPEINHKEK
jgi:hypothetical protein